MTVCLPFTRQFDCSRGMGGGSENVFDLRRIGEGMQVSRAGRSSSRAGNLAGGDLAGIGGLPG